jgi:tetratricopeptide (TPR) repeat protein
MNNLAILYKNTQRFEESEAMYKEALETYRRLAASNPQANEPDVAMTLNNLASLYKNTQRLEESETMYKEALDIRRHLATSNPQAYEPDVASTLYNLASLYRNTQRLEESETMYKEALEISRRLAASNPQAYEPDVAATQYSLGLLYLSKKQYSEAIAPFEEALDIYRRLSKTNPAQQQWYEGSLYSLCQLYPMEKNYLAAYKANQEWLPIMKNLYEADQESLRSVFAGKLGGQSFYAIFAKQFAESERYANEGLTVDSTKHIIYTNLAASLLFQGKVIEGEAIYRQYKDELKDSFLDDFKQFEEAGVIPEEREEDVERIKQMLNEP